jgi:hypothetical protein
VRRAAASVGRRSSRSVLVQVGAEFPRIELSEAETPCDEHTWVKVGCWEEAGGFALYAATNSPLALSGGRQWPRPAHAQAPGRPEFRPPPDPHEQRPARETVLGRIESALELDCLPAAGRATLNKIRSPPSDASSAMAIGCNALAHALRTTSKASRPPCGMAPRPRAFELASSLPELTREAAPGGRTVPGSQIDRTLRCGEQRDVPRTSWSSLAPYCVLRADAGREAGGDAFEGRRRSRSVGRRRGGGSGSSSRRRPGPELLLAQLAQTTRPGRRCP